MSPPASVEDRHREVEGPVGGAIEPVTVGLVGGLGGGSAQLSDVVVKFFLKIFCLDMCLAPATRERPAYRAPLATPALVSNAL